MATKRELEAENNQLKVQLKAAMADVERMTRKLAEALQLGSSYEMYPH